MIPLIYFLDIPFIKHIEKGVKEERKKKDKKEEGEKKETEERQKTAEEELKKERTKSLLYSIILDRYREMIEEKEEKSISALKHLVNPEDEFILEKTKEIKEKIKREKKEKEEKEGEEKEEAKKYDEKRDFEKAIEKAAEYIKSIETIRWPASFWLSFGELNKYRVGDDMDKCIFFCSLLRALGSDNARILIEEDKHPYIMYCINNNCVLFDVDEGEIKKGTEEEILKLKTFIYAFNDKEYEDLEKKEISLE